MKRREKVILMIALGVLFVFSLRASGDNALLEVIPGVNLPGMPFGARVEITNTSRHVLYLHPTCELRVRTPAGNTVIAGGLGTSKALIRVGTSAKGSGEFRFIVVEPGDTAFLTVPFENHTVGPWADEATFTVPGRYWLSMVITLSSESGESTITTPDVEYIVEQPVGIDRKVWERMKDYLVHENGKTIFVADGAYPGLSEFIYEEAPDSSYAPFVVGYDYVPYSQERVLKRAIAAIEKYPEAVVTEKNQVTALRVAVNLLSVESSSDPEWIRRFVQDTVKVLEGSSNPDTRLLAKETYELVKERGQTRE